MNSRNILILHGISGNPKENWFPSLEEVYGNDRRVLIPQLPDADEPKRDAWLNSVKEISSGLDPSNTIIIGHSLGAVTALDFIEQLDTELFAFISVAGFARPYGFEANEKFMQEKKIEFKKVEQNLKHRFVIFSDNDPYVDEKELIYLARKLEVTPIVMRNAGHFNSEAGFDTFPLLVSLVDGLQ